jgi:hypothetical protein
MLMLAKMVQLSRQLALGGLIVGNSRFTPTALFFTHGNMETDNGETDLTANRISQDIVCNAYASRIQMTLNDAAVSYKPLTMNRQQARALESESETFEYQIEAVATAAGCFAPHIFLKSGYQSVGTPLTAITATPGISFQECYHNNGSGSLPPPPSVSDDDGDGDDGGDDGGDSDDINSEATKGSTMRWLLLLHPEVPSVAVAIS